MEKSNQLHNKGEFDNEIKLTEKISQLKLSISSSFFEFR